MGILGIAGCKLPFTHRDPIISGFFRHLRKQLSFTLGCANAITDASSGFKIIRQRILLELTIALGKGCTLTNVTQTITLADGMSRHISHRKTYEITRNSHLTIDHLRLSKQ